MPRIRKPNPEQVQAGLDAAFPKPTAEERTLDLFAPALHNFPANNVRPPDEPKTQIDFIQCKCGLKCSTGIWTQWGWRCESCGRDVDKNSPREPGPCLPRPTPQTPEDRARLEGADVNPGLRDDDPAPSPGHCGTCGARLTQTNVGEFFPCGHGGKSEVETKPEERKPMRRRVSKSDTEQTQAQEPEQEESPPSVREKLPPVDKSEPTSPPGAKPKLADANVNTVTVCWAEEMYGPQQFHLVKIGPFYHTVEIRQDETRLQAMERAMDELIPFAEKMRTRKRKAYAESLKEKF